MREEESVNELREAMLEAEAQERTLAAEATGGATPRAAPATGDSGTKPPEHDGKPAQHDAPACDAEGMPEVSSRLPLREQARLVLVALATLPVESVMLYNGRLSRIRRSHKRGVHIEAHSKASLRGRVARCCRIMSSGKDGTRETIPSDALIDDLLSLPEYPDAIKRVTCVSEMPIFVPGGRLLTHAGFDESSGIYLWPPEALRNISVSEKPTQQDVAEALAVLDDVLVDFPFVDRASRANYLAVWLTCTVRHLIDGCVPALVIDAPQQGSGKGLLTGVLSITSTGRDTAVQVSNGNDEELRKLITSCLRHNTPIIALDNVQHLIKQPALAAYLTSTTWQDRILGHNRVETYPAHAVVIVNGNNVAVGGDLSRRLAWCRLDPASSTPWEREGFRHNPLPAYVKEQRPEIVRALLTIAQSWFAAGGVSHEVPMLGSFETWCYTVGNILAHAGITGFLENRHAVYERADEESSEFNAFLDRWNESFGSRPTTVREAIAALDPDDLPSALTHAMAGHGNLSKKLAKLLSRNEKRRFGPANIHVVSVKSSANTLRWQVIRDEPIA